MLRAFVALVVTIVLTVTLALAAELIATDPEHVRPDHRERLTGVTQELPLQVSGADPQGTGEMLEVWSRFVTGVEAQDRETWIAAELERLAAEEAERLEAARRAPNQPVARPGTRATGPYADAAECTRAHEGWYTANTGNGYYGAYQFLQPTWDNTVRAMGRLDLVGVRPSDASPADQDAAFWFLWSGGAGAGHWGGRCLEYA